jgi:PAS domain S-box-containing protein
VARSGRHPTDTRYGGAPGERRGRLLLLAVFVVIACLIGAGGYWAWTQQSSTMEKQADMAIAAVARLKADQIGNWLDERLADATIVSGDPWLAGEAATLAAGRGGAGTAALVTRRLDAYSRSYHYSEVVLLAPDGRELASVASGERTSLGALSASLARRALATGKVAWSDIYLGSDGQPRLEGAAPLQAGTRDDEPAGVVLLVSDPAEFLYPLLRSWPVPSDSGETMLVERRGDRVVWLNELRFKKGTALRMSQPLVATALPAAKAAAGQSGKVDGVDYRGVQVFAAARPVAGTAWHVVAKLDSAEVLSPIRERVAFTAVTTVLLVALVGLLTYLIRRSREHQMATELLVRERRYRELMDNLPAGVVVHGADMSIEFANPLAADIVGLPADDMAGRSATDPAWGFLREDGEPAGPDDLPVPRVAASGEPVRNLIIGRHQGGAAPVWALCNAFPERGEDGELRHIIVVFVEITDRVQAEAEVRASERRFRETVEHLDEGYYSASLDGVVLDHNPAVVRMLGLPEATDLRGMPAPGFLNQPDERSLCVADLLDRSHVGGQVADLDRADGTPVTVVLNAHVVDDEDGAPLRIDGTITDITPIHQAQEEVRRLNAELERRVEQRTAQLAATNKELESFAFSISHDLRAPLRALDGFSEILLQDYGAALDETAQGHLRRIKSAADHMAGLMDALLQLSRLNREELLFEEVDLTAIAESVVAELREQAPGRQVDVLVEGGLRADADPKMMRVVLANLLGNAWKFTSRHETARIEVGVRPGEGEAPAFYVKDDGAGFDPRYARNLFGAFQRLHTPDQFEGTGIGLATVQRIVHRHGGVVWAESEVEEGATFWFTLQADRA